MQTRKRECYSNKDIELRRIGFSVKSHYYSTSLGGQDRKKKSSFSVLSKYATIKQRLGKYESTGKVWVESPSDFRLTQNELETLRLKMPLLAAAKLYQVRRELQKTDDSSSPLCSSAAQTF
jgi:hypothetical protein